METATISAKGWVVIPAAYRKKYGIKPGDRVRIVDYGGVLSLVPDLSDPIRDAAGMLQGQSSLTAALLEDRARDRQRER